ncbi:actinorhodin polyketide synthase [Actinomadura craniellae]|uniref:Actinorhodin polyketide synthase n=1 Tax=Actinomadura craniellae TaxID=2231787 RepID=A0A365H0W0_9ACTN|nr:acyl carrier protein [Actinomadura craniellae]RAY12724.1 actinorhodin polyketide synthase [Actinomadura craniellae]
MTKLTVTELMEIMRECAGEGEGVAAAGDGLPDTTFELLGYDSLALLETAARIERDYGVRLDDDQVTESETPRELLSLVNGAVTEVA